MQRKQIVIHGERRINIDTSKERRVCPCEEMPHLILNENIAKYTHNHHVRFSVDDFPSGSNCKYNVDKMEGIHYVKIDGIWLRNMLDNFKKEFQETQWEEKFLLEFRKILLEVKKRHKDIIFIVERVEDEDLFKLFHQIPEIQYFQGYHFSKTKAINEIEGEVEFYNRKSA